MGRTLLRLSVWPLLAVLFILDSASGPTPILSLAMLVIAAPVVCGLLLLSFWRLPPDSPQAAVPQRARRVAPLFWLVGALMTVSVVVTQWPLHWSFRASKPQLEQLVNKARSGKTLKLPQKIGLFNVTGVRVDEEVGVAVIYLNGADDGDDTKLQKWFSPTTQSKTRWNNDKDTVLLDEEWLLYAAL